MYRFRTIVSRHHWSTAAAAVSPPRHHRTLFRRTLILQTAADPVRIERLSDSDSGIVELKLDRPEVKNAISKEMLRRLQHALEAIAEDAAARVVMVAAPPLGFSAQVPTSRNAG